MKRLLIRNIKIIVLLLALAAIFQNCSNPKLGENETISKLPNYQVTGIKCPIYLKPVCDKDAQVRLVENEKGCSYHICEKNRRLSLCPRQSTPLCKAHQEIREFKDQNSCSYFECGLKNTVQKKSEMPQSDYKKKTLSNNNILMIDKKSEDSCPNLENSMSCESGMIGTLTVDKQSCLKHTCKKQKKFSCPILKNKVCRKNETTFFAFDQKGCPQTVCKNTVKVNCPERLSLGCKRDEFLKVILDGEGCKKSLCVKKPVVLKKGCNLNKPPRCFAGRELRIAVLADGCTKPYCH